MGACYDCPDLKVVGRAAKMRIILTEPTLHTTHLRDDSDEEGTRRDRAMFFQGNGFEGNHPWRHWYSRGVLGSIYRAEAELREQMGRPARLAKVAGQPLDGRTRACRTAARALPDPRGRHPPRTRAQAAPWCAARPASG